MHEALSIYDEVALNVEGNAAIGTMEGIIVGDLVVAGDAPEVQILLRGHFFKGFFQGINRAHNGMVA